MTDHLAHSCGGRWQPIMGWTGRYRCDKCGAIGYRQATAPRGVGRNRHGKFIGAPEYIVPYKCSERGCERPAVRKVRRGVTKVWSCSGHSSADEDRF